MKAEARVLRSALMFERLRKQALEKPSEAKGFLGPSLRENPDAPSIGRRVALGRGLIVDDAGKMRCPAGTPNANQFTDLQMSNCMIPSAETAANEAVDAVANVISRAGDGFKRGSHGKGKDANLIPKAGIGFANSNGFLEQRRVMTGNSVTSPKDNLRVQLVAIDDSVRHLADGGSMTDIPDEHLTRAIQENTGAGKRFEIIGEGGGIWGMTRYRDNTTDALIGIKYIGASREANTEAAREVASELVLEHMGYEPMPMRIVIDVQSPQDSAFENYNGVALVTELAHNRHSGNIESARISDRDGKYDYKLDPKDIVRMGMLDTILWNSDRHEGNFMIARDEQGNGQLIPIDNSRALAGKVDLSQPEFVKRPSEVGLEFILNEYFKDGGREKLVSDIKDIQEEISSIDIRELQQNIEQLFQHMGFLGVSLNDDDKEAMLDVIQRIQQIKNPAWAESIASVIAPEWLRPNTQPSTLDEWVGVVDSPQAEEVIA